MPNDAPDWSVAVATVGAGTITPSGAGTPGTVRGAAHFVPQAAAHDIIHFAGLSAGFGQAAFLRVRLSMNSAALQTVVVSLKYWNSNPTGGTSTSITQVTLDGLSVGGLFVFRYYTADPSGGGSPGNLGSVRYQCGPPGQGQPSHEWRFGDIGPLHPLYMSNIADHGVTININGATVANVSVEIESAATQ